MVGLRSARAGGLRPQRQLCRTPFLKEGDWALLCSSNALKFGASEA
jgi:hypothetical protein